MSHDAHNSSIKLLLRFLFFRGNVGFVVVFVLSDFVVFVLFFGFELTVTGPGGSARDTVRVSRVQDLLRTSQAEFRTNNGEWRVTGTATVKGPSNTITLFLGPGPGGPVLGTADVDALGNWTFRERNAIRPPNNRTLRLESAAGGQNTVQVRVRR